MLSSRKTYKKPVLTENNVAMEDTRTLKAAAYCLEGDENITKYV